MKQVGYQGDSEISNDIGLREGVRVYVSESYPFKQIGGRTVTLIKSSSRLSGGAIALVAIIAGCAYYFIIRRRTGDASSDDEKEEL